MKKKYIFGGIFILFGVLLALLPNKIAPVCHVEEGAKNDEMFLDGTCIIRNGNIVSSS